MQRAQTDSMIQQRNAQTCTEFQGISSQRLSKKIKNDSIKRPVFHQRDYKREISTGLSKENKRKADFLAWLSTDLSTTVEKQYFQI